MRAFGPNIFINTSKMYVMVYLQEVYNCNGTFLISRIVLVYLGNVIIAMS